MTATGGASTTSSTVEATLHTTQLDILTDVTSRISPARTICSIWKKEQYSYHKVYVIIIIRDNTTTKTGTAIGEYTFHLY